MIRALLLIVAPSRTWETIKNERRSVLQISLRFLLPLLLLVLVVEGFALLRLGVERGSVVERIFKPSRDLVIRYEAVQGVLFLVIIYAGAIALQAIGASFHRRHTYTECFTT